MTVLDVFVNEDSSVQCVYDDVLRPLFKGEDVTVRRASHVEPASAYGLGGDGWLADMRPTGGPILAGRGGCGYPTRAEALAAERMWLADELSGQSLKVR